MEILIALAITLAIVFGVSNIIFPEKKSDNSLTGNIDKKEGLVDGFGTKKEAFADLRKAVKIVIIGVISWAIYAYFAGLFESRDDKRLEHSVFVAGLAIASALGLLGRR